MLPVTANATNTVAMWPGELASIVTFRRELRTRKQDLTAVVAAGAMGGAAGAFGLLETSQARFLSLVPWLLIFATALFAFGASLRRLVERSVGKREAISSSTTSLFIGFLLVSFYTGLFDAGAGILAFTTLSLFAPRSLNELNSVKALCTTLASGVAVILFVAAGAVSWPQCIVIAGFAALGGYAGAAYSRRLSAWTLRSIVIVTGTSVSAPLILQRD